MAAAATAATTPPRDGRDSIAAKPYAATNRTMARVNPTAAARGASHCRKARIAAVCQTGPFRYGAGSGERLEPGAVQVAVAAAFLSELGRRAILDDAAGVDH